MQKIRKKRMSKFWKMEVTVGQNERENGETRIHRPFPYKPSRSTPIFTHRKMVRMIHRQITYLLTERLLHYLNLYFYLWNLKQLSQLQRLWIAKNRISIFLAFPRKVFTLSWRTSLSSRNLSIDLQRNL